MELDTAKANIKFIKESYPKKVRIELINSLLDAQSSQSIQASETLEKLHNLIDQIFSTILKNLKWNIATSKNDWDYRPIDVMKEAFPKIEKTKWFSMRHQQVIDELNK